LKTPFVIIVINDRGGGIFSFLPISGFPNVFEKYFAAAHTFSFEMAAKMFQIGYVKVKVVKEANWDGSTNIESAFRNILKVALENKVPQNEMPKSLLIISDMEFNAATSQGYNRDFLGRYVITTKTTYYEVMTKLFNENGYELPKVVFWNVSARNDTFHAELKDGVQFASGQSTSVFKSLISGANLGPYELMVQTLSSPMYDAVTL